MTTKTVTTPEHAQVVFRAELDRLIAEYGSAVVEHAGLSWREGTGLVHFTLAFPKAHVARETPRRPFR